MGDQKRCGDGETDQGNDSPQSTESVRNILPRDDSAPYRKGNLCGENYRVLINISMMLVLIYNVAALSLSEDAPDTWRRTNQGWERSDLWRAQPFHNDVVPPLQFATIPRRCWPATFALSEALLAMWILTHRDVKTRKAVSKVIPRAVVVHG